MQQLIEKMTDDMRLRGFSPKTIYAYTAHARRLEKHLGKRPYKSTHHVLEYLGRYSHRVAISNSRLIKIKRVKSPSGGGITVIETKRN